MAVSACSQCKAPLHPGDVFCGNCGAPASAATPAMPPVTTPAPVSDPIAVAQMPTMPPPVGPLLGSDTVVDPPRRSWWRLVAGIGVVMAVAAVAGLGLALLSTRDDLDNERAKLAQVTATRTRAPGSEAGAIDPQRPVTEDELRALQSQLGELNAALLQAQTDLATERAALAAERADLAAEREGRAADATQQAQAVADLQAQLAQLQSLFPVTQAAMASADPTGPFAVALTAGECTLDDCTPLTNLTVAFTDPTTIAGDRVNGAATVDGEDLVVTGSVAPASGPLCQGQPADATYRLVVHVTAVDATAGVLRATRLRGTYTETVGSGACTGLKRAYSVDLTRA